MVTAFQRFGLLACIISWLIPSGAAAYEDLNTLDVGLHYGALPGDSASSHTVGLQLSHGWGIGDAWSVRARTTASTDLAAEPELSRFSSSLSVDAIYLVDIVQLIPVLGAGIGLHALWTSTPQLEPSLDAFVGLDYLIDRRRYLSGEYRISWMPLWSDRESLALAHSLELRFGWRLER